MEEDGAAGSVEESGSTGRKSYAIEAAALFEKQLALVLKHEDITRLGPAVVDGIQDETRAAYRRDQVRWEKVSTRTERALVVTAWVASIATLCGFAWWAEGPPTTATARQWIWAALAPVAGLGWLCLLLAPLGLGFSRFSVWKSVPQRGPTRESATSFDRLPRWARLALVSIVALGVLVLALWLGRSLLAHWPRGLDGLYAILIGAVLFFLVIGIAAVGSEIAFSARVPSDFRDQVLLILFDCISVACYGRVLRDPPKRLKVKTSKTRDAEGARGGAHGNAGVAEVEPPSWRTDAQKRLAFVARLNGAGRYVEGDAARLAPRSAPEVRKELRDYGRRVAAGFRKHAGTVALGGKSQDDEVVQELIGEYIAAAQGRWRELGATDAPALTKRLAIQIGQRLAVVGVLLAAAFLVAPVVAEGAAQAQLRGILLGSAVLALTAPRDAVNDLRDQAYRAFSGRGR